MGRRGQPRGRGLRAGEGERRGTTAAETAPMTLVASRRGRTAGPGGSRNRPGDGGDGPVGRTAGRRGSRDRPGDGGCGPAGAYGGAPRQQRPPRRWWLWAGGGVRRGPAAAEHAPETVGTGRRGHTAGRGGSRNRPGDGGDGPVGTYGVTRRVPPGFLHGTFPHLYHERRVLFYAITA